MEKLLKKEIAIRELLLNLIKKETLERDKVKR